MTVIRNLILVSALTIGGAALTGCGFKPMHAPAAFSGKTISYDNISVTSAGNDKIDFLLKQSLRDRMGETANTKYILDVKPRVSRRTLGISDDDVASRYDMNIDTRFTLTDKKTGDIVLRDRVRAVSTFGAPRDAYGTIAAENNATEQVASEAADRIIVRLATYFEKAQ